MSETIYLLDSNAFMTPANIYYAFDFESKFWDQLKLQMDLGRIVILDLVRDECTKREDELKQWFEGLEPESFIDHRQSAYITIYAAIMQHLEESPYYSVEALKAWAESGVADPWLIAVAKENHFTIVTFEAAKKGLNKNRQTSNPKVPNIAEDFGVEVVDLFSMMRDLGIKLA